MSIWVLGLSWPYDICVRLLMVVCVLADYRCFGEKNVVLELNLSVLLLYVHGHLMGVNWLVLML
jgi:hypothetical protein